MDWRVISIGTLPLHPLWDPPRQPRSGHATTTLVRSGDRLLLVDPSLPPAAMAARLEERSGLDLSAVTDVFLTNFHPDRRRALAALDHATWHMHAPELAWAQDAMAEELDRAEEAADASLADELRAHRAGLERFVPAADAVTDGVDLFPMPGVTPGTCGLLLALPMLTVLICGDAIATGEHLERGQVLSGSVDLAAAMESFKEAVEIADVLVPGRDNVVLNPLRS